MLQKIKARVTGNVVEGREQLIIRQAGPSKVLNFTLASNNFAPEGTQQTTSFIRVSAWNRDAECLVRYLSKGKPLTVSGRLELRPYQSRKYHDETGTAARMLSAELRMEHNGFEFIDRVRRQVEEIGDAGDAGNNGGSEPAPAAAEATVASAVGTASIPNGKAPRKSSRSFAKRGVVASARLSSSSGVQEGAQTTSPV